jgi:hypothetical protein
MTNRSPLSEENTNKSYFTELLSKLPIVRNPQLPFVFNFNSWVVDFVLKGELFTYKVEKCISFDEIANSINIESPEELSLTDDNLVSYLNRKVLEITLEDIPDIKLQGHDESAPSKAHLTKKLHKDPEFCIGNDCVFIALTIEFIAEGEIRNSLFNAIDLTKFTFRYYGESVCNNIDVDNCTALIQMSNGVAYCPPDVDIKLLSAWCKFQLFSLIFKVKVNPFFEQDGLVHMSTTNGRTLFPRFDIPSCIENIHFSNTEIKLTDIDQQYVNFNI